MDSTYVHGYRVITLASTEYNLTKTQWKYTMPTCMVVVVFLTMAWVSLDPCHNCNVIGYKMNNLDGLVFHNK
jgi:hypothetical protein